MTPSQLARPQQPAPPDRRAHSVVLTAMEEEARPFLERLPALDGAAPLALNGDAWAVSLALPPVIPGSADGQGPRAPREFILIRTGIGLVAAASALAAALARVAPRMIISAGTAGGLARDVEVGDVCASTTLAFTDADATAFGYARGQIPGQPPAFGSATGLREAIELHGPAALAAATPASSSARIHAGQMLSGNSFVTAANVADTREAFPEAVSTDMESAALAQVAAAAGIPFASVRGISDLCGPEAGQDFHIGADEAAARSAAVVIAALAALS
ncbi:5'-methylthioadenosine/S-adenosylhomocysteine nucleosidase [Actinomyces marmotae]|uniref:5'-methylthioadenosine/S-adenosylhomocysteine nucleosidase n=1 Tax=Actinomyces marmotae TaxID=2737173 RepID=UPI00135AC3F0|nr:5'-methylthioadenosine/S-adenosylhomocysteine nucleosidase [Actinomyces marmotae]